MRLLQLFGLRRRLLATRFPLILSDFTISKCYSCQMLHHYVIVLKHSKIWCSLQLRKGLEIIKRILMILMLIKLKQNPQEDNSCKQLA